MNHVQSMVLASVIGLSAGFAFAQPSGGMGQGTGPMAAESAASSVGMGPGTGMGPSGDHRAMRWSADNTPGWKLMTEQERTQHGEHMRAMKTQEECKAYVVQHHEEMAARAKERRGKALPMPRRDPCASLPK